MLDAPNTHLDVGLLKPSEYDVSALPRKSRAPLVGITAGAFNASNPSADERVALPRFSSGPVAIDRYRGTYLATAGQIAAKRVGDLSLALVDVAADEFGRELEFLRHVSAMVIALTGRALAGSYAADLLCAAHQEPCRRWQFAMRSGPSML